MNIARPGASVVIDPAVRDGVPTILGTEVTTLDAMERTMAFPYEETKNATRLGITLTQRTGTRPTTLSGRRTT